MYLNLDRNWKKGGLQPLFFFFFGFSFYFRGYSGRKLTENVECEIFQTILEEALESYSEDIVFELNSDTVEQLESNVERITAWARGWKAQRAW